MNSVLSAGCAGGGRHGDGHRGGLSALRTRLPGPGCRQSCSPPHLPASVWAAPILPMGLETCFLATDVAVSRTCGRVGKTKVGGIGAITPEVVGLLCSGAIQGRLLFRLASVQACSGEHIWVCAQGCDSVSFHRSWLVWLPAYVVTCASVCTFTVVLVTREPQVHASHVADCGLPGSTLTGPGQCGKPPTQTPPNP